MYAPPVFLAGIETAQDVFFRTIGDVLMKTRIGGALRPEIIQVFRLEFIGNSREEQHGAEFQLLAIKARARDGVGRPSLRVRVIAHFYAAVRQDRTRRYGRS